MVKKIKAGVEQKSFPLFDDRKFRILIEKSFDVITVIDRRGKVLYASPSIVRLYGRPYNKILGISGLRYVHPIDIPKITKLLAQILLFPKKPISVELRVKHANGEWRWVKCYATNLLGNKKIRGIVVNFHDITDRKILEERKDEFLSIASHELKTPITSLKAYVQLIIKKYSNKDEQLRMYLDKIDGQMNRLNHLISELLDISRINEGKLVLNKEKFIIENLISDVIGDIQKISEKHQIFFEKKYETKVIADKDRITQVLINLLTNAIRYSPGSFKIIVSCRKFKDSVRIYVQDFGTGIPKDKAIKIFERFYQETGKKGNKEGLGLGLYLSAIFVSEHGGKIDVTSTPGKGSTFSFSLPI